MAPAPTAPHELLDDGFAPEPCDLLVVGCGNVLRGDDAFGPVVVRHLHERGVPTGVRLVDGGTAGMDVAFGMRGAARVVLLDAAATGADPGTLFRVPAADLVDLPPLSGLHSHTFRWDHALALAEWLLGPLRPTEVTVLLAEVGSVEPGAELTAPVAAAVDRVLDLLEREFFPPCGPDGDGSARGGHDGRAPEVETGDRRADGGRAGAGAVGGLPAGDQSARGRPEAPGGLPDREPGAACGRRRTPDGGATQERDGGRGRR